MNKLTLTEADHEGVILPDNALAKAVEQEAERLAQIKADAEKQNIADDVALELACFQLDHRPSVVQQIASAQARSERAESERLARAQQIPAVDRRRRPRGAGEGA